MAGILQIILKCIFKKTNKLGCKFLRASSQLNIGSDDIDAFQSHTSHSSALWKQVDWGPLKYHIRLLFARSRNVEGAWLVFRVFPILTLQHPISRLQDLARSYDKSSYCIMEWPYVFYINTLGSRKRKRPFSTASFNENAWISVKISLNFGPKSPIDNNPTLV